MKKIISGLICCFGLVSLKAQNVGIGTNNPEEKLHILNGNLRINHASGNGEVQLQRGGENRGYLQLTGDNGEHLRMGTYYGGTGNVVIRTNGADRVTVSPAGYMFIPGRLALGSAAQANHSLNVAGNSSFNGNDELIHLNGTGTSRMIRFYRSSVAKAHIQLSGDHLVIGNSTGNDGGNLRLHGNQITLGTNTAAAGYKVSIGGKVICTELRVELANNWPDYVFEDDYTLTSLEKVENHIQEHKHLPNIPSASKLSESGLHLGEMQRLHMEKIEELFLHVISLKKEIARVKAENKTLKAAVR